MSRALRFCMLATFYPPFSFGGDAIQVERLAAALAERGHDVTVVHSLEAHRAFSQTPRDGEPPHPDVKVIAIDAGVGTLSPLATYLTGRPIFARRELERALDGDFDVVHFHNPSLLGGPGTIRLGSGIKLYTAHEQWLVCPTHVLWKYRRRVCERPTCWRCSLTYGRPPQVWRSGSLLERSLSELDALVTPSRTSLRLHERFAGLVRLERIPHFVPEPEPAPPAKEPERPYFLFVGRLEPIKGIDLLVRAFARRSGPEQLLIAGTGSLEERLRREAQALPNVRFLGWQPARTLDHLYRGALATVTPSRGHEAFALVPVESFARGTPAIVHDFGALGELVAESGGALGFRTDAELDEALDRLAADDALRSQLGARGREAQQTLWSVDVHLTRYLGLVAELARARGDTSVAAAAEAAAGTTQTAVP
jgi:glycosyltransferase involved in cell wall biosynthesis